MELPQYLKDLAKEAIETERPPVSPDSLRRPVGETDFFVTEKNDPEVVPYGAITVNEKEYIIGPLRQVRKFVPRIVK